MKLSINIGYPGGGYAPAGKPAGPTFGPGGPSGPGYPGSPGLKFIKKYNIIRIIRRLVI